MAENNATTGTAGSIASALPSRMPTMAAMIAAVAVLYFAQEVFLPLAIAVLLTFAIAPVVGFFRRLGLSRLFAVIVSVAISFSAVGLFSAIVAYEVSEVAENVPAYQSNIVEKIRGLKESGSENGLINRLSKFAERVGNEINKSGNDQDVQRPAAADGPPTPMLVEIFSPSRPIETLKNIISPLIGPLATGGLIIVVVIFMLLEREELRDRFIRLVGYGDLHKTTEALQEAGQRVGHYLLMQLLVNVLYGVPLGIGLWLLGIPNALLWGMLAIVLRFVPYIGPVVAAVIPLFLAFAVAPGWSLLLWTAALFLVIELISGNVIEPLLYGSNTGLSPLAIIVSAIFWGWLWGPVGLVLSTPLTVCLVVLGRHVPQFEFFDIIFGSEPVLDPKERLYQRLLAGDADEATDNAEEILEDDYLADYYGNTAIPALLLGEQDRLRGVLTAEQMQRVAQTAEILVANLDEIAAEEEEEEDEADPASRDGTPDQSASAPPLPSGEGHRILSIGGQTLLDDVSAAMLAQVLNVQGAEVEKSNHSELGLANLRNLPLAGQSAVVVSFFNQDAPRHARFIIRRLRKLAPKTRIGIVLWQDADKGQSQAELAELAERLEADFVAGSMSQAVIEALSDNSVRKAAPARTKPARRLKVKSPAAKPA